MSSSPLQDKVMVVDPFCYRQFAEHASSSSYGGTVFDISMQDFERIVNERYHAAVANGVRVLDDGYAPFCKHFFVPNDFSLARVNVLPITAENEHLLRTKYEARNDQELPVLTRFFPKHLVPSPLPVAQYLDLILYSREQIVQENAAQEQPSLAEHASVPWGIVSIKAQNEGAELPMTPITAMRNALGKEQGGSGVPIDPVAYRQAVDYWKDHAVVT
jgi:Protein of unknown function (DUF3228)